MKGSVLSAAMRSPAANLAARQGSLKRKRKSSSPGAGRGEWVGWGGLAWGGVECARGGRAVAAAGLQCPLPAHSQSALLRPLGCLLRGSAPVSRSPVFMFQSRAEESPAAVSSVDESSAWGERERRLGGGQRAPCPRSHASSRCIALILRWPCTPLCAFNASLLFAATNCILWQT